MASEFYVLSSTRMIETVCQQFEATDIEMIQQPYIYILSLTDSEKRRAPLILQLESMGLEYSVWDAIDGRQGLPEKYESLIDREQSKKRMGRNMSDAEFACALSHRAMQQDVLNRNLPGALILEDDAVLTESFNDILSLLPLKGHDITLLHHKGGHARRRTTPISPKHKAQRITLFPNSAAAYYITRTGAARMVAASTPVSYVADWPLDLSLINSFVLQPCPVQPPEATEANSAIEKSRINMKKLRYRNLQRFLDRSYWKRKYLKLISKKLI
ncbi:glycosyltransferase family 25 protein [Halocynthiibacter styelae]|uniref:Glycosyltransferase family 25 protein n=1 Tax=Halocynthiibacter styelae TaxID=2761955 RepID=A0A8J7J178_9RHOB|nr:glycosyltransferase family 25 protein [Paenihalocynthiibacter styelae]MBI1495409.1 glycosyltransferase family 25 protein [Paenihalocynthiibacter styelae]